VLQACAAVYAEAQKDPSKRGMGTTMVALLIIALEFRYPHRREWLPSGSDIVNDATYMGLVQVLLPRFLSFFVIVTILRGLQDTGLTFAGIWPVHWPIVAQAFLMMISAEFLLHAVTYRLHACPSSDPQQKLS